MENMLLKALKDMGIAIPAEKEAEVTALAKGYKDQTTIDDLVVKTKNSSKEKVLKALGFKDVDEAKTFIEKAKSNQPAPNPGTPGDKTAEEMKKIQDQIEDMKKKQEETQRRTEQQQVENTQLKVLTDKGFTETAAKRLRTTIVSEMKEDDKFEDKVAEFSKDDFYKSQFDKAAAELKRGTVSTHTPGGASGDISDSEMDAIAAIFGNDKDKK